jgi:hypothetical protein
VAKKLADIKVFVEGREPQFKKFLREILDEQAWSFVNELSKHGKVYIFSGVIRNFFLGRTEVRDIDIMFDGSYDLEKIIGDYTFRKNSYGGYKVNVNNLPIDLWYLNETWALKNSQRIFNFEIERHIPNTSFFNFASILYNFNETTFIYSKHFLRFLRDKEIDYVFKPNANYALCVVNAFYYKEKLHLRFSERLKKYLVELDHKYASKYEDAQLKHFGKVLYSQHELAEKINHFNQVSKASSHPNAG